MTRHNGNGKDKVTAALNTGPNQPWGLTMLRAKVLWGQFKGRFERTDVATVLELSGGTLHRAVSTLCAVRLADEDGGGFLISDLGKYLLTSHWVEALDLGRASRPGYAETIHDQGWRNATRTELINHYRWAGVKDWQYRVDGWLSYAPVDDAFLAGDAGALQRLVEDALSATSLERRRRQRRERPTWNDPVGDTVHVAPAAPTPTPARGLAITPRTVRITCPECRGTGIMLVPELADPA